MSGDDCFTLVFKGKISSFNKNPFLTETPFGTPYAAGIGNAFEEADKLREKLERLKEGRAP
jgi:hypothetical protein